MVTAPYERIWITIRYTCGCVAAKPVFRTPETEADARSQGSPRRCDVCEQEAQQAEERRVAMPQENNTAHYMVDGHRMLVIKDKDGYWRGRAWEDGRHIRKYFGKEDPRDGLEEAL